MSEEFNTDKLIRAISLLKALRSSTKDANEYNDLSESHVSEFHNILLSISTIGIDVPEFHIPDTEIQPSVISSNWDTGERTYSSEKYVRKSIFLTKLDGIINYLSSLLNEPKRTAGFKPKE